MVPSDFESELDTELATFRSFGGEPTEPARPDFKVLESSCALTLFYEENRIVDAWASLLSTDPWVPHKQHLGEFGQNGTKGVPCFCERHPSRVVMGHSNEVEVMFDGNLVQSLALEQFATLLSLPTYSLHWGSRWGLEKRSSPVLVEQLGHQQPWPDSFLQFIHSAFLWVSSHNCQLPSSHPVIFL